MQSERQNKRKGLSGGVKFGPPPKRGPNPQGIKKLGRKMQKNSYESLPEKHKIIFLAGLFDGEGSFGYWGKGGGRKSFQCSVEMCDRDIVQRFVDLFGGSLLPVKVRNEKWKQTWKWKMSGRGLSL